MMRDTRQVEFCNTLVFRKSYLSNLIDYLGEIIETRD